MPDWPTTGRPSDIIISNYSEAALAIEYGAVATTAPTSAAHGTVNLARFYPFVLPEPVVVLKVWWYNGATVNGNTDVGIYDEWGTRLISSGAVAQAGTNVIQESDVTDTVIGRGRFYMAISSSSATATYFSNATTLQIAKTFGWAQMATAHPLPATVTLAASAGSTGPWPVCGCAMRTLVV